MAPKVRTVNVAFQANLLSDVDRAARSESRSRSDLLREAARMYIERKKRWRRIFAYGEKTASRQRLSEADVSTQIQACRRERTKGQ